MVDSIVKTLGVGSGIDYAALVDQLVTANFQARNGELKRRDQTLASQLSTASTLKSNIADFAAGLKTLTKGGTLSTQVSSSNTEIVRASVVTGAKLAKGSTQIEVRQLAQSQSAASAYFASRTAAIGTGTLQIQLGTATTAGGAITGFTAGGSAPVSVTIDASNNSLDGIAAAINAANAGVTASIVTDSGGARLALKGKTGEAQAFTLSATEDAGAEGLAGLAIGVGSTVGSAAQDAIVAVDGIAVKRDSNSVSDLVTGVKLDLASAKPGTTVTLTTSIPTDALKQSVNDFVSAYNNLLRNVESATSAEGDLRGDPAARNFRQSLGRISLTQLSTPASAGTVRTLAEIGVATNRDGTLTVNSTRLDAALASDPDAVAALFADGTGASGGGLAAAFQAIADRATDATTGLGASIDRYTKQRSAISEQRDKILSETDTYRARLTRQFSSVDARVAAYKSAGSFLTQQFKTKSSDS